MPKNESPDTVAFRSLHAKLDKSGKSLLFEKKGFLASCLEVGNEQRRALLLQRVESAESIDDLKAVLAHLIWDLWRP